MASERLQKILARTGVASRRHSEALITAGRVSVNDQVVTTLGTVADAEVDRITVDGRPIPLNPQPRYFLLNKPRGFLSTCFDPQGRKTVLELVPFVPGLHPVGRLDKETSGLLILTNDGTFTETLTHPRHGVSKTYLAEVQGRPDARALAQLRQGVILEGGKTLPARVEVGDRRKASTLMFIAIREGRNRQIRRMAEAVGHPVIQLERIAIGDLTTGDLPKGAFRALNAQEVQSLLHAAKRGHTHG
jgi:pseudouridine synthase